MKEYEKLDWCTHCNKSRVLKEVMFSDGKGKLCDECIKALEN